MSPFRTRLKTPEEVELEKKRAEFAAVSQQLAERDAQFRALKTEIRLFEQVYEQVLGHRIAILEELEWQLNGMLGQRNPLEDPVRCKPAADAFNYFHHRTDLLDELDIPADPQQKSFKTLYRDVAKTIHPDLAPDDEERKRRQELMAIANQAYACGDRKTLEDILFDWEPPPPSYGSELDVALALVRLIREIARAQQDIHAVNCQIEELRATDIYQFKQRVDDALADGIDLLAEMASTVERDIARAQNRLALLRGDDLSCHSMEEAPLETRIIRFPPEPCGVLFERTRSSVDFRDWKRIGAARGTQEVFLDKAIRLDVKGGRDADYSFLQERQPDDIQALFLYDVDDRVLPAIAGLTGLEELYLSNTTISDRGLLLLGVLTSLQRLYLYHTPVSDIGLMYLTRLPQLKGLTCSGTDVTDDGLNRFRELMPGCKAVSFKWRYD